jgi:hypothetical protein
MPYLPYAKLRSPAPTPPDEICRCRDTPPVKLVAGVSFNPVHCMLCNLDVPPETLEIPPELVDALAHWRGVCDALYTLWLDSGEYEEWAAAKMADLSGAVNRRGLAARADLDAIRRCYYFWFQDESAEDFQPAGRCPLCSGPMTPWEGGVSPQVVCERCGIVASDSNDASGG